LIKKLSPEYFIDTDNKRIDVELVYRFLTNESYWAKDRSLKDVEKSIINSLCFGLYKDDTMVGFARIISDYTTAAFLADVFIIKEERGNGLGKALIEYILDYPSLKGIKRWMLGTMDAHELYRPYGFSEVANPNRWMERLLDDGF
jgi:GNAT superfamily N-acetyltransferase